MWQSDEVHVFLSIRNPFLGSRMELLRKFSISCVVFKVISRSKSVETTRSYHTSVV